MDCEFKVYTISETFVFNGDDAREVSRVLNDAGVRNTEWSQAVKLSNGKCMIFVMNNIIAMEYD